MDISSKIAILNRIYGIYEKFCSDLTLACKRYCSQCCTCNVTLTSLEAFHIVQYLTETRQTDLLEKLERQIRKPRFQPKITTNAFAAYCIEGREPPDEDCDPAWGTCPFLTNDECPIYKARPFGCRCFVSRTNCKESGAAEIDDFVLTVNTVFLQYIEQLDIPGLFGNFSDMILKSASHKAIDGLIANSAIRALMIPSEHRKRIQAILQSFRCLLPV
jgi:hypothetical protein